MMLTDEEVLKIAYTHTGYAPGFDFDVALPDNGAIEKYTRAVIAANNAKVLDDLKPDVHNLVSGKDCYSTEAVSALIQERDSLAARVKELEKLKTTHKAVEDWEKCAYSEPEDEKDQNLCDALRDIRASVDVTEAALKQVLVAVQEYLPPDGITKDDLISRVIACVDPWPSDRIRKIKEQL